MSEENWENLERDDERGFQTLGREVNGKWEVEVRFDGATPPKRADRTASSRKEAKMIGQEIFMASS